MYAKQRTAYDTKAQIRGIKCAKKLMLEAKLQSRHNLHV
jgi:hypothetical protein